MSGMLLVTTLALSASSSDVELFSIGCSGTVDWLSGLPYGVTADLSNYVTLLQKVYDSTYSRVKCHCPTLTEEQFKDRFSPARAVFNMIGGTVEHEEKIPCLDDQKTYTRDLQKYLSALLMGSEVTLPETCNRAKFVGEEGCAFEMVVQDQLSANLRVNVAECPNSIFPAIGVWCAGDACSTLFRTCSEGSCATGQECVEGATGLEKIFGFSGFEIATDLVGSALGFNLSTGIEYLYRQIDGDINSDRTLDDCDNVFASFSSNFLSNFAKAVDGSAMSGVCVPEAWDGWSFLSDSYYGRFDDCNFHVNAGDCESNDDFEYFMAKLYCKYKQKEGCLEYSPYCYWNRHETGKHKCKFNHTTQNDGFTDDNWMRGLSCSDIDSIADKCEAAETPSDSCEHEYCACSGGKWSKEDATCEPSGETGKCSDMMSCWGAFQQCYEKMGDDSPYMRTVTQCENFFLCRCVEQAKLFDCDPKSFCGRRCACMHSEKDRFIGPYCDIRLVRGTEPTLYTYDDSNADKVPIISWDGKLASGAKAAKVLRTRPVPAALAAPKDSDATEPIFVSSCDGRFWIFPKSKFGVAFHIRNLDSFARAVTEAGIASFRCAIGEENVAASDPEALKQLIASYYLHMPSMWYHRFFDSTYKVLPATLADYIFNVSGEAEPSVTAPELLAEEAQALLSGPSDGDVADGGWLAHIGTWVAGGVETVSTTIMSVGKALKWLETPTWQLPLLSIQNEQDEDERNRQIRELIMRRQAELVAEQRTLTGPKRTGPIIPPKSGAFSAEKIGFRVNKDEMGPVDFYTAQCPSNGLAEVQFGVGGKFSERLHLRVPCKKDADCGDAGKCVPVVSTMWGAPMYDVDFLGGFLWGGNFTKGFVGGCPILSTTVNQAAFSTVKGKCHGVKLWVDELKSYWTAATGNEVMEGSVPAWCFADKASVLEYVTGSVKADEAIDLSAAKVLSSRPFELPAEKAGTKAGKHDEL
eukprot:gene16204-24837_t